MAPPARRPTRTLPSFRGKLNSSGGPRVTTPFELNPVVCLRDLSAESPGSRYQELPSRSLQQSRSAAADEWHLSWERQGVLVSVGLSAHGSA